MGGIEDEETGACQQVRRAHVHDCDWPGAAGGAAMINLMPTDMKEQIRFAKYNRSVLRYLWGAFFVVLALGGVFGWALYSLNGQTNVTLARASDKQQTIDQLTKSFVPQAKEVSD